MNGRIEERRDGLHWLLVAVLVVGLTLAPVLVPLYSTLNAIGPAAPGQASLIRDGGDETGDAVVDVARLGGDLDETFALPRVGSR